MKRILISLLLALLATTALAFNPDARMRIGVLRSEAYDAASSEGRVASLVREHLVRELRREGFDAYDATGEGDADYYVELVRGHSDDTSYGGVGVGGHHFGVEMGVVVARVAASVRLYDARGELVDDFAVTGRDSGVLPTAIGIGGRYFGAWLPLPGMRGARHRAAAREAGREGARLVARALDGEGRP